jgi:hypothetical protein
MRQYLGDATYNWRSRLAYAIAVRYATYQLVSRTDAK